MTQRTEPPFRADHVGSLLRPQRLMDARAQAAAGEITREALREIEDDSIRDVVAMQRDVGLQSATDGEFRRTAWHMDFIYALGGVTQSDEKMHVQFFNESGTLDFAPAALRISDRIRLGETIFADHFTFLQRQVGEGVTPKLTIPSPSMVHYRGGRAAIDETVYPDLDEFWDDLTAAYAEEVRRLGDLGCTYLQLDDTSLAYLNDPQQRELIASLGGDREHQHELYIRNINRAIAAKPPSMRITTHMCAATSSRHGPPRAATTSSPRRCSASSTSTASSSSTTTSARAGSSRCGSCRGQVRRPRPRHHQTWRAGEQGHVEAADRRGIEVRTARAACLSPQCGFSSTVEGNSLSYDDEVAKLALIVETAAEVWS